LLGNVPSIEAPGKHDVGEENVGCPFATPVQSLFGRCGFDHLETCIF
jgi:hypothetical protein